MDNPNKCGNACESVELVERIKNGFPPPTPLPAKNKLHRTL